MPDPPAPKERVPFPASPSRPSQVRERRRAPAYAELHCKTNFSFLEGASHPDELVQRANELGYAALAITDRHSLAGVVRAHVAAHETGLKLLIGAEVCPVDGAPLVLLAPDRAAYGRLARLLTVGRRQAPKGECRLTRADIADHAPGLLAGVLLQAPRAIDGNPLPSAPVKTSREDLDAYRSLFGDRCYALVELHGGPADSRCLERARRLARESRVPLAAANDVHYHVPKRQPLQDVITSIRTGRTVEQAAAEGRLFPNAERHLKPLEQLSGLFSAAPELLDRTCEVAARCQFSLSELRYEYPEELCPAGLAQRDYLAQLTWEGARARYGEQVPDKVRGLIEHELQLIGDLNYEAYFLTVWDLVRFARARNILCQGRGSAANSVVCFCLGVTSVDPERIDVLFERFISRERNEAPDIDVDFEHERREEVLQYVYEKYGRDRAGMTAEVITYRPRSAIRDVGKALGLSLDCVDRLAKGLEVQGGSDQLSGILHEAGLAADAPVSRQLMARLRELLGFPRHLSQHVGGMVMTQGPLCELVPIENAAMPGRTVIQWDKDDLDALGILKVDCLALGMLTALHRGFDLLQRLPPRLPAAGGPSASLSAGGPPPRPTGLAEVPPEDPAVYDMVCRADTVGVFQIESRAQMSMLPRLRPRCYYDLVIEVAIVRPGPIQGDMVHPYLRRRMGEEAVEYPNDAIRQVLQKTLGVPIFQEQAMRLAVVAAGFTHGQADQLRRAMGAWRRPGLIEQFEQKLIDGMQARGYTAEFAQRVFQQICGFGEYGFPESHSASFALLVYVSAWLKHYYPAVFTAALLNSQPMGFYAPAQLVRDLREHGGEVRPVDINASDWDCTLEPSPCAAGMALRLGFRLLSGCPQKHARAAVAERERGGPFSSIEDLARRTQLGPAALNRWAQADAFGSLRLPRRQALWRTLATPGSSRSSDKKSSRRKSTARRSSDGSAAASPALPLPPEAPARPRQLVLFDGLEPEEEDAAVALPPMPLSQQVAADYRTAGLSLRAHPLKFLRPLLNERRVLLARQLAVERVGRLVRVAGLVLLRQKPGTAQGIIFMTLEDETGCANLIVRPQVWQQYHRAARMGVALLATGHLERQAEVIHVVVNRLEDISDWLSSFRSQSRDFH